MWLYSYCRGTQAIAEGHYDLGGAYHFAPQVSYECLVACQLNSSQVSCLFPVSSITGTGAGLHTDGFAALEGRYLSSKRLTDEESCSMEGESNACLQKRRFEYKAPVQPIAPCMQIGLSCNLCLCSSLQGTGSSTSALLMPCKLAVI